MANSNELKKSKAPVFFWILCLAAIMVGAFFLFQDELKNKFSQIPRGKEQLAWEKKITTLEQEIATKEDESEPVTKASPNLTEPEPFSPEFSEPKIQIPESPSEAELLADELLAFLNHLDSKNYFHTNQYKEKSLAHFKAVLSKLFANPPIITREVDDLFNIMNNMAHFFRVLGKKEIVLLKDILEQEDENIERLLALFYRWSEIGDQVKEKNPDISLPLKDLYEYAGFFLNTLGGQAYLFRRESHIRMLTKYYAILILDRANTQNINKHGIDIRFPINSLIDEMEASTILTKRDKYLDRLLALQLQYQIGYR